MTQREELLNQFLSQHGWGNAKRTLLAKDASFRWYDRLQKSTGETRVLMNAPTDKENPAQFAFVDEILEQNGLTVPHIYARDLENGFLLLEDLGDNTFSRLIKAGANEEELYSKAIDSLVRLHTQITNNPGLKDYDFDLMYFEASLLPLWYVKYVLNTEVDKEGMQEFKAIWEELYTLIRQVPDTLVLLDYHVDNLMITPDDKCALLDFQDARFGPVTYDLASLLEDARRPVDKLLQEKMKARYFEKLPQFNTPAFEQAYPLMAVQRHTKVIGIFVRLFVRDGKSRYLDHIPFVWSLLEKHLDNPYLSRYKAWLDKYVPQEKRAVRPFLDKEKISHEN